MQSTKKKKKIANKFAAIYLDMYIIIYMVMFLKEKLHIW